MPDRQKCHYGAAASSGMGNLRLLNRSLWSGVIRLVPVTGLRYATCACDYMSFWKSGAATQENRPLARTHARSNLISQHRIAELREAIPQGNFLRGVAGAAMG